MNRKRLPTTYAAVVERASRDYWRALAKRYPGRSVREYAMLAGCSAATACRQLRKAGLKPRQTPRTLWEAR